MRVAAGDGGGSGIIYEVEGTTAYIVTNQHVIAGGAVVRVRVHDSEPYEATVVGADTGRDLAVLRICCGTFQAIPFAEGLPITTGMDVLVIGYPGGAVANEATVTRGIVSAIGPHEYYDYGKVIQTDAAINPGNSGGPVFSLDGKLIGIATFKEFIHADGRQAEALGFAIPASTVLSQLPALRSGTFEVPPTVTPTPTSSVATGSSGELRHAPGDGRVKLDWADVSFADFLVEATFINPYSGAEHPWSHGFILRSDELDDEVRLVISSDGQWATHIGIGDHLQAGTVQLDVSTGGRNHIRLLGIAQRGWLFVNGSFIAQLDLADNVRSGDIGVATGMYEGTEREGAVTRYEGFIWESINRRYGPSNGDIEDAGEFIGTHKSFVSTRDIVVEATFTQPSTPNLKWDCGFIIRATDSQLDVVGIDNSGEWFHQTLDREDGTYTPLASDGVELAATNHLLFIAVADKGWIFLNGRFITSLDLGHNINAGSAAAFAGFYSGNTGTVSFRDFTVWAP